MAAVTKCNLTFEFEGERPEVLVGGSVVKGRLIVEPKQNIDCKALTVFHHWETHGRGNVATGQGTAITLFSGKLSEGEKQVFSFEVPLLHWPPTYHGHYLNIGHSLRARIDIPWAFDVHEEYPIVLRTTGAGESNTTTDTSKKQKSIVGFVLIAVMLVTFTVGAVFLLFPLMVMAIGFSIAMAVYWLFAKFLPRRIVGDASTTLTSSSIAAGDSIRGEFKMSPSKPALIDGIVCTLTGEEVCVSGSGSKRKTHRHTLSEKKVRIAPQGRLPQGNQVFPFEFALPRESAVSMKLDDNSIVWTLRMQVEIPRWPDFRDRIDLTVLPSRVDESPKDSEGAFSESLEDELSHPSHEPSGATDSIDFQETASMLCSLRDDREHIDQIIDATRSMTFSVTADIERSSLYSSSNDREFAYPDGRIVLATHANSPLKLTLYFSQTASRELDTIGGQHWDGRAMLMGYDFQHDRLQMRVLDNEGN